MILVQTGIDQPLKERLPHGHCGYHMKKLFLLLFITATAVGTARNPKMHPPVANTLARLLMEFESNVNWSAIQDSWKKGRTPWVSATINCSNASCVADKLVEFESNIKWSNPKWAARRTAWIADCKAAKTNTEVAKLMIEVESYATGATMADEWKARHDGWVKDCSNLK
jgi:hypothetical protein